MFPFPLFPSAFFPSRKTSDRAWVLDALRARSSTYMYKRRNAAEEKSSNQYKPFKQYTATVKPVLFYFDPNTINPEQWKALGLRDKTIQTIHNYRERGGRFSSPQDLQKIYGLHPDDYQRLLPFVRIAHDIPRTNDQKTATTPFRNASTHKLVSSEPIDINTADTAAWISLRGIGTKLASRIVNFRQKLGGFFSVDQVAETYALPDSTFLKIRPLLKMSDSLPARMDINTADANTLKQHPYIRWNLANAIVQYRNQHGAFKSIDDLQQLALVTPEVV